MARAFNFVPEYDPPRFHDRRACRVPPRRKFNASGGGGSSSFSFHNFQFSCFYFRYFLRSYQYLDPSHVYRIIFLGQDSRGHPLSQITFFCNTYTFFGIFPILQFISYVCQIRNVFVNRLSAIIFVTSSGFEMANKTSIFLIIDF